MFLTKWTVDPDLAGGVHFDVVLHCTALHSTLLYCLILLSPAAGGAGFPFFWSVVLLVYI
jgi:hypothetical protein